MKPSTSAQRGLFQRLACLIVAFLAVGASSATGTEASATAAPATGRLLVADAAGRTWWATPQGRRLGRVELGNYYVYRVSPRDAGTVLAGTEGRLASGDVMLYLLRNGRTTLVRAWADSPAWSPGGDRFTYVEWGTPAEEDPCRGTYWAKIRIRSASAGGKSDRSLLTRGPCVQDESPSWDPTGTRVAFSRVYRPWRSATSRDGIHVVDLKTGRVRRLLAGGSPVWSPSGRSLAISRGDSLYTYDLGTRALVRRAEAGGVYWGATHWSPDSRYLAHTESRDSGDSIGVIDLATGRRREILKGYRLADWIR